ncbi:MAG: hypothetical protein WB676_24770 [Bryobacteraceae bacterium]
MVRIENAVASLGFPAFFEPRAALESIEDGHQKLRGPMASTINAWRRHVAFGTITRIRALSVPVVQHLLEQRLTVAAILQRTILENAGRAAFAVDHLTRCSSANSWNDLRVIIPKSLFGTCMTSMEDTLFEDFWDPTAQRPTQVAKFLDALEKLAGTSDMGGQSFFPGLYAFLCDLAHASQRANQSYCQVLDTGDDGWTLQYEWRERAETGAIQGALKSMKRCIQAGYGASVMLLAWDFADGPDGLAWHGLSEKEGEWIWENLLDPHLVFD